MSKIQYICIKKMDQAWIQSPSELSKKERDAMKCPVASSVKPSFLFEQTKKVTLRRRLADTFGDADSEIQEADCASLQAKRCKFVLPPLPSAQNLASLITLTPITSCAVSISPQVPTSSPVACSIPLDLKPTLPDKELWTNISPAVTPLIDTSLGVDQSTDMSASSKSDTNLDISKTFSFLGTISFGDQYHIQYLKAKIYVSLAPVVEGLGLHNVIKRRVMTAAGLLPWRYAILLPPMKHTSGIKRTHVWIFAMSKICSKITHQFVAKEVLSQLQDNILMALEMLSVTSADRKRESGGYKSVNDYAQAQYGSHKNHMLMIY